ncbi:ankyrin repeat domain-containing protein [Spirosoma validum]|uniref:Ankyrin repeat domain-containing protein n=1 Tax=Spirosoma validum TaxID=2771355 RepID=A0A927B805_9BACT|nr:hypothetical protein [Spirosoma validum]MBD2756837.1 hypothetical protein [Spirosoma validum]
MLKYITIVNWVAIASLGLLVIGSILFPMKGGDAAGRGMGEAFLMLAAVAVTVLLVLNLLPFSWAKYTAFTIILMPFAIILLDTLSEKMKDLVSAIAYSQSDYDGSTYFPDPQRKAILAAVFNEDIEQVEELLREPVVSINGLDTEQKRTILDYVATSYSPYSRDWGKTKRILEVLIAAGATINSNDSSRVSTHAAVVWNATPQLLKFLLDHGADPNAQSKNNVPILYEVIRAGGAESIDKVKLLVDRGAKINVVATYDEYTKDYSPLLFASAFEGWAVCLFLTRRGADIHYKSSDGSTLKQYIRLFDKRYKEYSQTPSPEFNELKAIVGIQIRN